MKRFDQYFTRNIYFGKEAVKNMRIISEKTGEDKVSVLVQRALDYYAKYLMTEGE